MKLDRFVQTTVRNKGISGVEQEDPYVFRVNNQIVMLEEMFESRKSLPIKRPNIKA